MTETLFHDRPPTSDHISAYDEQHLAIYLRLLMAEEEGADWREVVQVIFGIDPQREPDRAKLVHDSHLARALDDKNRLSSPADAAITLIEPTPAAQ